ncbi:transposase family protein [Xanthobacter dioxanivorans]|uniref:Transposase family protein n=1 Tax=Xanthobacter dioxanivorans TaxID=2528964 RepID=A0A974SHV4_9HYPH|nr:transposase family protein [Xanthobacter dioxanivorans]
MELDDIVNWPAAVRQGNWVNLRVTIPAKAESVDVLCPLDSRRTRTKGQAETQAERAFDQVVGWLEYFEPLEDPRQVGKVWYRLDEVLLLCLVAVLAAAESWVEIAEFG